MKGVIVLQSQEEKRVFVIQKVIRGEMTAKQAATFLGVAKRHVYRLKKKMQKQGVAALVHGNRGKPPSNAISKDVRERIVALACGDYSKASCEHMAELLASREEIILSSKTIGRILKAARVTNFHAHRAARRRPSRERRSQEGMLSQCDASPHDWLEGRGPEMSLHGSIDDATSKVQGLHFRLQEDTVGYLNVLNQVVTNFGVPQGMYSDRHTIFFSPKTDKLSVEEQLAGVQVRLTQFGQALHVLKIQHIPARSPQAKGRVERLWGTLQHRLMIELRLARISTMEEANAFLPEFIQRFNTRFAVAAQEAKTGYRPAPSQKDLDRILCQRYERKASQGSTISFEGQRFFLLDEKRKVIPLPPGANVEVLKHLDGAQKALYRNHDYALKALLQSKPVIQSSTLQRKEKTAKPIVKPSGDHPWKQPFSAKGRLIAKERKRLASLDTVSADETNLSEVERQPFESLSSVFGMNGMVRDKNGKLGRLDPKPLS
jgi:transposase